MSTSTSNEFIGVLSNSNFGVVKCFESSFNSVIKFFHFLEHFQKYRILVWPIKFFYDFAKTPLFLLVI